MKVILFSALAALVTSVTVQQITYRNSMEYKLQTVQRAMQAEQTQEMFTRCESYKQLKAGDSSWEPIGDYYDQCK